MFTLGQVHPYQQQTDYSCAAANLLAVLKHYGVYGFDEPMLRSLIGVNPRYGASMEKIVRAAREIGMRAEIRSFKSLAEVRALVKREIFPIANVESWTRPQGRHYVTITGIDDQYVYVMDTNVKGNRRILTHNEMLKQWTGWRRFGYTAVVIRP